jgi:hypothetical protein
MIHLDAERYREEKTTFVGEKCWGMDDILQPAQM